MQSYPTILLVHGGGWKQGDPKDLSIVADYFTQKGYLAFLVSYRLKNEHNTTPEEALKDVKSAIRYVRKNAEELHINPDKIAVIGISAGGHLAAASAAADTVNEVGDDTTISAKPNLVVLYNPLLDLGPGKYGYHAIEEKYLSLSPLHLIKENLPPTYILTGTNDRYLSKETVALYVSKMKAAGNNCEMFFFEGAEHGLIRKDKPKQLEILLKETALFLNRYL